MSEETKKPRKPIPDELSIHLTKAVTLGGGGDSTTYATLDLHEPNYAQLSQFVKNAKAGDALNAMKMLITSVSGVPGPVIEAITVRDYYRAQAYLSRFLEPPDEDDEEGNVEGSQQTGG